MTKPKNDLWWAVCSELDLYGSNWPPQLARIFLIMADHANRVTDHIQDDTTMMEDVANWLRYEAQQALEAEPHATHDQPRYYPRHEKISQKEEKQEKSTT